MTPPRLPARSLGGSASSLGGPLGDARRQFDGGAVLPESLQRVEGAVLLVLHVHDDVEVVQKDPAALPFALTAGRLRVGLDAETVLDLVHDGADLTVV
jgi:hypothetical protein